MHRYRIATVFVCPVFSVGRRDAPFVDRRSNLSVRVGYVDWFGLVSAERRHLPVVTGPVLCGEIVPVGPFFDRDLLQV